MGDGVLTRGAPQTSQPHLGSSDPRWGHKSCWSRPKAGHLWCIHYLDPVDQAAQTPVSPCSPPASQVPRRAALRCRKPALRHFSVLACAPSWSTLPDQNPLGLGSGRPLHPTTHSCGTGTQAASAAGDAWSAASSCVAPRGPCEHFPRVDAHPGVEPLLTGRISPSSEGLFSERQHQLRACSGAESARPRPWRAFSPPHGAPPAPPGFTALWRFLVSPAACWSVTELRCHLLWEAFLVLPPAPLQAQLVSLLWHCGDAAGTWALPPLLGGHSGAGDPVGSSVCSRCVCTLDGGGVQPTASPLWGRRPASFSLASLFLGATCA